MPEQDENENSAEIPTLFLFTWVFGWMDYETGVVSGMVTPT
jgi:hypothetical protein